jgi:hypothetical protein
MGQDTLVFNKPFPNNQATALFQAGNDSVGATLPTSSSKGLC